MRFTTLLRFFVPAAVLAIVLAIPAGNGADRMSSVVVTLKDGTERTGAVSAWGLRFRSDIDTLPINVSKIESFEDSTLVLTGIGAVEGSFVAGEIVVTTADGELKAASADLIGLKRVAEQARTGPEYGSPEAESRGSSPLPAQCVGAGCTEGISNSLSVSAGEAFDTGVVVTNSPLRENSGDRGAAGEIVIGGSENAATRIRVLLQDGSVVVGAPRAIRLPFDSSFGTLRIDLGKVQSFAGEALTLADGSVLKGRFGEGTVEVTTSRGDLEIPAQKITAIASASGGAKSSSSSELPASGQGVLTGQVLDNFHKPVAGALLQIPGSTLQATTDLEGRYRLAYVPGRFAVRIDLSEYEPTQFSLDLPEVAQYPVEDKQLLRLPPRPGVFYKDREGWARLQECRLVQTSEIPNDGDINFAGVRKDAYRVEGSPLRIAGYGHAKFLDNTPSRDELLIYRLDDNGEIITDTRSGGLGGFAAMFSDSGGKKGATLARYEKKRSATGRGFYYGKFESGTYAIVDRRYQNNCFMFQIGEGSSKLRPDRKGRPTGVKTLAVDGKSVSFWPSPSRKAHAQFRFDSHGYRNTYTLGCQLKRFRWTKNVRLSTGKVTGNSTGAEWKPLNPRSKISNAVFDAICFGGRSRDAGPASESGTKKPAGPDRSGAATSQPRESRNNARKTTDAGEATGTDADAAIAKRRRSNSYTVPKFNNFSLAEKGGPSTTVRRSANGEDNAAGTTFSVAACQPRWITLWPGADDELSSCLGSRYYVVAWAPKSLAFEAHGEIQGLFRSAFDYADSRCEEKRERAQVFVIHDRSDPNWKKSVNRDNLEESSVAWGCVNRDGTVPVYFNAEAEEAARKAQKEAEREALFAFVKTAGAEQTVTTAALTSNPFPYAGKVIAVEAVFSKMLSASEAMFAGGRTFGGMKDVFIVSSVPTTRFSEKKQVLLAGRVIGNKPWKSLAGGEVLLAHVEFVEAFEGPYSDEDLSWAHRENENPNRPVRTPAVPKVPPELRCSRAGDRGKPCRFGK